MTKARSMPLRKRGTWPRIAAAAARLRWFGRDRRGVGAIEFAIVAPVVVATLCATGELGYVQFEQELMQDAIGTAARQMQTGMLQGAGQVATAQQFVQSYLCPANGPRMIPTNFNCSQLIVDVRPYASFTSADLANDFYKSAGNEFCPGQPGQVVVVRVAYPLGAIMPLSLFQGSAGVVSDVPNLAGNYHILMATALFQDEQYAAPYTAPTGC